MRLYQKPGLTLGIGNANDPALVRALQHDLRALGYLRAGIDGNFGEMTARAIRSLQIDLMQNNGAGRDGTAPVAIMQFNSEENGRARVTKADGVLDESLAACIDALLSDSRVTLLPSSEDPASENARAVALLDSVTSAISPAPFIIAMLRQESGERHYCEPSGTNQDNFVTAGLDYNDKNEPDRITSRGFGVAQYTFFHHPLRASEIAEFVVDAVRNVQQAFAELRGKFDHFVVGTTPDHVADDRVSEHPRLAIRLCKYAPPHPLYMRDCKACAAAAGKVNIADGTPLYHGSTRTYTPTSYYSSATYLGVPDRATFLCDWPYAVRRYNGSGVNSYHYQTRILLNLLR